MRVKDIKVTTIDHPYPPDVEGLKQIISDLLNESSVQSLRIGVGSVLQVDVEATNANSGMDLEEFLHKIPLKDVVTLKEPMTLIREFIYCVSVLMYILQVDGMVPVCIVLHPEAVDWLENYIGLDLSIGDTDLKHVMGLALYESDSVESDNILVYGADRRGTSLPWCLGAVVTSVEFETKEENEDGAGNGT